MLCSPVLLLSILVVTAAAQDNDEQQEPGTLPPCESEGYGPPQNLTVTPVRYTNLNVSWEPPDVEPQYYEVHILLPAMTWYTNDTFYFIEDLSYCTECVIVVASIYEDETCMDVIAGKTNIPPPDQPQSCTVHTSGTDSLYVDHQGGGGHCGENVSYSVSWKWLVLWNNEEGSYTGDRLYNVEFYTNVTATVSVSSGPAVGIPPSCSLVTPQGTSSAPTDLSNHANGSSSLLVRWSLPTRLNGALKGWLLNWRDPDGLLDGQVQLDANCSSYRMEDIDRSRLYYINIMAINGAGLGYPGRMQSGYTRFEHSTDVGLTIGLSFLGIAIVAIAVGSVVFAYKKNPKCRAAWRQQNPSRLQVQEPSTREVPLISTRQVQEPSTHQVQEPSTHQVQEPSTHQVQEPTTYQVQA